MSVSIRTKTHSYLILLIFCVVLKPSIVRSAREDGHHEQGCGLWPLGLHR